MVSRKSTEDRGSFASPVLGPLETEVMDVVWDSGEVTVRDVCRVLLTRREIAYTTVMTVMGNLAAKGALRRTKLDRTFLYTPAVSRDDFNRSRIAYMVDSVFGHFSASAMTYLVDRMAKVDPQRLSELEKAIASLRQKGGSSK